MSNKQDEIKGTAAIEENKAAEEHLESTTKDVPGENLDSSVEEADKFKQETDQVMEGVANNDANSAEEGAPGVEVKQRSSHAGKFKSVSAGNGLAGGMGELDLEGGDYISISDLDKYEKDRAEQAFQYDRVSAKIKSMSTRDIESGMHTIVGQASDVGVYSLENLVTPLTYTNAATLLPINHPQSRSIGTLYRRGPGIVINPLGDYIAGLHDVAKGFAGVGADDASPVHNSAFILNSLDSQGHIVPNKFQVFKTGKFLLRGFNPFIARNTSTNNTEWQTNHIKVQHTANAKYYRQNEMNGAVCEVEYYWSNPDSNKNLFDVVDVTPTMENVYNVFDAVTAESLLCVKSKMTFGLFESLANTFIEITRGMSILEGKDEPEVFFQRNRSSLWNGERTSIYRGTNEYTFACKNDPSQYFRFMEGLRASESVLLLAGLNALNGVQAVKWGKGQTGKNGSDTIFSDFSGMYQGQTALGSHTDPNTDINLPNMVPYLRSLMSARGFQRAGFLISQAKDFHSRVRQIQNMFNNDESLSPLLSKVYVMNEIVKQFENALSIGKFVESDGMSSNAVIKLPETIDIILDYDPNDLIGVYRNGAQTEWLPTCGYCNFVTDENVNYSIGETFYVLPIWLDSFIRYLKSDRAYDIFKLDLTSANRSIHEQWLRSLELSNGNYKNSKCLLTWLLNAIDPEHGYSESTSNNVTIGTWNDRRFIPIQTDSLFGNLWGYMMMDAFRWNSKSAFQTGDRKNAYSSRYLPMFDRFEGKLKAILEDFFDTDLYTVSKNIFNNDAFKLDGRWQTPDEFPTLSEASKDEYLSKFDNNIATIRAHYRETTGTNSDAARYLSVRQPAQYFSHLQSLKGITIFEHALNSNSKLQATALPYDKALDSFTFTLDGISLTRRRSALVSPTEIYAALATASPSATSTYTDVISFTTEGNLSIFRHRFAKIGENDDDYATIERLLLTVPVTNYDVDQSYYHANDDLGNTLYGKDHFLVPNSDYLIMGARQGVFADATRPSYHDYDDILLLPAEDYFNIPDTLPAAMSDFGNTPRAHGYFAPRQVSGRYNDTDVIIDTTNRGFGVYDDKNNWKKLAYRILTRTSLYGYMREATYGLLTLKSDYTGRQGDAGLTTSLTTLPSRYASVEFGFMPRILGAEVVNNNWEYNIAAKDDLHYGISDSTFFNRQKCFVGDPFAQYASDINYDICHFEDLGNWILSHSAHATYMNGGSVPKQISALMEEDRERLYDYYHMGNMLHCPVINPSVAGDYLHMDVDFIYDNKVLTRSVYNDMRTYRVGRPVRTLDRLWRNFANYIPLLYTHFVEQRETNTDVD